MNLKKFVNRNNIKNYLSLTKEINKEYQKLLSIESLDLLEINFAKRLVNIKEDISLSSKNKIINSIALAKMAAKKVLGMPYYDVQIMGALALIDGCIAEMKTGEGKTLTCSAAVAANFALGNTTHVATANDYLAQRDEETLKPLYEALGIKSNYTVSGMSKESKKLAYQGDVVYSTAQEFGFDFLRDNLIYNLSDKIQLIEFKNVVCIIDEADFILIDEARTPLIMSGESPIKNKDIYHTIKDFAFKLKKMPREPKFNYLNKYDENLELQTNKGDYWLEEKYQNAHLSETGYENLEKLAKNAGLLQSGKYNQEPSLYQSENSWLIQETINAIKAQHLFSKDKDYVVSNGEIIIIDQNTGRLSHGRSWSNGLHQAIEAKENVTIQAETMTLGSISIQNYFRNYSKISGMSGTIMESSEEFEEIYQCKTIQIPTNKNMIRRDHTDQIYLNVEAKYNALIENILNRHNKGQPILIGTTSVSESEIISDLLKKNKIQHHVLNAKNNALEAQIIAQAGQPYSVTVATSMAGRGTDIILGGNKEVLQHILNEQIIEINNILSMASNLTAQIYGEQEFSVEITPLSEQENIKPDLFQTAKNQETIIQFSDPDFMVRALTENYLHVWDTLYHLLLVINRQKEKLEELWSSWREQVLQAGGLCVIGSSRNESRRIDDQLRGRSGRQGDPGESIFFISTKDSWVSVFGNNAIFNHLAKTMPANQVISSPSISKAFAKIQKQIESMHFDSRKHTYHYDSIADEGRQRFLMLRNSLLTDNQKIKEMVFKQLSHAIELSLSEDFLIEYQEKFNLKSYQQTKEYIKKIPLIELLQDIDVFKKNNPYFVHKKYNIEQQEFISQYVQNCILIKQEQLWDKINMNSLVFLDSIWIDHLNFIEEAQKNVSLRYIAQKNPLYEFKKICFESFSSMIQEFKTYVQHNFIETVEQTSALTNIAITLNMDNEPKLHTNPLEIIPTLT